MSGKIFYVMTQAHKRGLTEPPAPTDRMTACGNGIARMRGLGDTVVDTWGATTCPHCLKVPHACEEEETA